ncbi:hypothetical protein [Limnoglobus roseus]|uniref:Uncharacterized protein n=1 Tax=Limnoglobus roseus TaxID=2598579 RepID=A0A5C1AMQ2_9BACT|nr:hypothetical protein [Limnoglobus roseus]QEL19417.1 hypothetical protein PX52LOC_06488 [Limnoglobus roseus]
MSTSQTAIPPHTATAPKPMLPTPTVNPFTGLAVAASGAEPLPVGVYFAVFRGVEAFSNDKVQDKLTWTWAVASGPHKGREATALTDLRLTPHTHAGRLLAGLVGRPLVPGEDISGLWTDVQKAIGQTWAVTVASGPKGGKPSVQNVSVPSEM